MFTSWHYVQAHPRPVQGYPSQSTAQVCLAFASSGPSMLIGAAEDVNSRQECFPRSESSVEPDESAQTCNSFVARASASRTTSPLTSFMTSGASFDSGSCRQLTICRRGDYATLEREHGFMCVPLCTELICPLTVVQSVGVS